jgi:hypothetical protein
MKQKRNPIFRFQFNRVSYQNYNGETYLTINLSNLSSLESFTAILTLRKTIKMSSTNQVLLLIDITNTEMSFTTSITFKKVLSQIQKYVLKTAFVGVDSSDVICKVLPLPTFACFKSRDEALYYLFSSSLIN